MVLLQYRLIPDLTLSSHLAALAVDHVRYGAGAFAERIGEAVRFYLSKINPDVLAPDLIEEWKLLQAAALPDALAGDGVAAFVARLEEFSGHLSVRRDDLNRLREIVGCVPPGESVH